MDMEKWDKVAYTGKAQGEKKTALQKPRRDHVVMVVFRHETMTLESGV